MGATFSVSAFGVKLKVSTKGTNINTNQKIEAFFQTAGLETAAQIYQADDELQTYFDSEGIKFPSEESGIPPFVDDLTNEQADKIAQLMMKYIE